MTHRNTYRTEIALKITKEGGGGRYIKSGHRKPRAIDKYLPLDINN